MHLRLSRTFFFAMVASVIAIGGLYYVLHQGPSRLLKPTENAGDYSVVIGGDFLSFNAFEFDSTAPLLPADYAYKNPYGLASWGHMVRDTFYAAGQDFQLGDSMSYQLTPGITTHSNVNGLYSAPFNGRLTTFMVPDKNGSITIEGIGGRTAGAARLMFFTGASDFTNIARFDIYSDGVFRRSVSLKGDDGFYRGRYQLNVDGIPVSAGGSIVLKNIVPIDGGAPPAALQFIGASLSGPSVHMTGHGGWTSQQVLADFDNMVGQYKPDLVFYQIGANDMALSVPLDTFKANLESFVQQVRALKPSAEIVLVTATPSQYHPAKSEFVNGYLDVAKQVSQEYGCQLIDLYDLLADKNPKTWRYDDVHAKIEGGQMIYDEVRRRVFPGIKIAGGYQPEAMLQVDHPPQQ